MIKKIAQYVFIILTGIILVFIIWWIAQTPSNNRDWNLDQAILPYADIEGNNIHIHNIRNFSYASTTSYTEAYYDKTIDLSKLERIWFVMEPFAGINGAAHTFLSFEFEKNEFVAISIEIRKEKGESFSAVKGLFNQYELMYVIADERDVVKLRSNFRKDQVYVYPIKTTKERAKAVFLSMIERANMLKEKPEFYNTIYNTCTTNILRHANEIVPGRIPFRLEVLLPANSDRLAYELGLIDTTLSFEEARKKFLINDHALKYADSPDFSVKIRQ